MVMLLTALPVSVSPAAVRPAELCGQGEVRHLAVQSFGPVHRALVLFTGGMVSIWDLRCGGQGALQGLHGADKPYSC